VLKSVLIAGATAFAFAGLGSITPGSAAPLGSAAFNPGNYAANVAGSATIGCLSSVASGGSCGSGAAAAAVGSALSPITNSVFPQAQSDLGDRIGGTLLQATAGGLASVAGGGKFANGAVTAGFQYLATLSLEDVRRDPRMDAYDAVGGIAKTAVTLWNRWPDIWDSLGHSFIQNAWATSLSNAGYTVEQEVRLLWPGSGTSYARADIMYQSNDTTSRCECIDDWGIIEIKTPRSPDLSIQQQNAYKAFNSGTAYSDATRITSFGYSPGQTLPAGTVNIVGPYVNQRTIWPPGSFGP
jgi:hypothetical protein